MQTLVNFIIIFNLIVFFHEMGHFIMARKHGVTVHEFALGMGPVLFSKTKGMTQYSLRALPLGGFCKMEGEDESSGIQGSFSEKTAWQRFSIIIAGPMMNFLLALLLFIGLNSFTGIPSLQISEVLEGSPANLAGIEVGDRIVEIDGVEILNWEEMVIKVRESTGEIAVKVKKGNNEIQSYVINPQIREGNRIIGVIQGREKNFPAAIKYSLKQMGLIFGSFFTFFSQLFKGSVSSADVAGPLGLVKLVDDVTKAGFVTVVFFTAFFSMNLGVMNLLPIPALDGGRLLFILIELIRGKPLDPDKEGFVHMVGFVFLMLLMLFVTFLDIKKWIG
ncbi:MAG: RIP metalloprotease RseP [Tissierellia bacterium]|jgi:regulator of sigma E protease|nr:RIP metalloprotease RseP [Tissierellia bacterium]